MNPRLDLNLRPPSFNFHIGVQTSIPVVSVTLFQFKNSHNQILFEDTGD